MPQQCKPQTLAELNEFHQQFWLRRSTLTDGLISDAAVVNMAVKDVQTENVRLPFPMRKRFDVALEEALEQKKICLRFTGKSGGRPAGSDALQQLIDQIVAKQQVTTSTLLGILKSKVGGGVIDEIDTEPDVMKIFFKDGNEYKEASISSLKDRLYRARKLFHSR
jgi:hypothetical protein